MSIIEINAYCNHLPDITSISFRRNFLFWFQVTMEEWLITTLEEFFSHSLLLYFLLFTLVSGRSQVIALKEQLWGLFSLLFYYSYKEYYLCLLFFPCCSCSGHVTGDNPEEAIVTVSWGNILDETWSRLSKLYTFYVPKKMKKTLLLRYKVSHIEIDCNEQKAPKMTEH